MKIGYARASTADQNLYLQFNTLTEYGCTTIYQEKILEKVVMPSERDRMYQGLASGTHILQVNQQLF